MGKISGDNKDALDPVEQLNHIMNYVFNDKPNPYALRDMLVAFFEASSTDPEEPEA